MTLQVKIQQVHRTIAGISNNCGSPIFDELFTYEKFADLKAAKSIDE